MGSLPNNQSQHIARIVVLREHERSDHAMYLIRKAASLVLPIMKKRNYIVATLTEICDRPAGWEAGGYPLGWNRNFGETIALRLREVHDHRIFLNLEGIIQTMLHELCHNIFTDHHDDFYALLKEHEWEYEQLTLSGFTGDPSIQRDASHSQGKRLGGDVCVSPASPPPAAIPVPAPVIPEIPDTISGQGRSLGGGPTLNKDEGRLIGLQAAETRRRIQEEERQRRARARKQASASYQQFMAGNRLGGKSSDVPIKLAGKPVQSSDRSKIAAAAERRRRDEITCGSGSFNKGARRQQQLTEAVDRGIQNGIQVVPEPIPPGEMEEIMRQIQMLEEAERLQKRDSRPSPQSQSQPPAPLYPTGTQSTSSTTTISGVSELLGSLGNFSLSSSSVAGTQSPSQSRILPPPAQPQPPSPVGPAPSPINPTKNPASTAPTASKPPRPSSTNNSNSSNNNSNSNAALWSCPACTLINPAILAKCSACETPRGGIFGPKSQQHNPSGEPLSANGNAVKPRGGGATVGGEDKADKAKFDRWECRRCRSMNDGEWWTCTECGVMKRKS